jgi:creatinine amidohydrolase
MTAGEGSCRSFGELTFPEISQRLSNSSIVCLPLGAMEQHGPHLPLNTDAVIAEELARRIIARWGIEFDLWLLPTVAMGFSREHDWAQGTLSLTITTFIALIKDVTREIVRSSPARNLMIVNGHGGNRGLLEALIVELRSELGLNVAVIHPFDLSRTAARVEEADVHGGRNETSVMLELAPHLVRRDCMVSAASSSKDKAVSALILDPGVSFPWRSDDPRLAVTGVIGDPRDSSRQLGREIVDRVVARTRCVLEQLLENQRLATSA